MPNSHIRATVRWGSSLPSALLPRWSRVHQTPINDWRRRTGGMVWLCVTSVGAVWLLWTTRNPLSSSSSADCIAIWVWGCVTTALVCGESARSVFDSCRLIMGFMHPAHAVVCINKVKCLALAEMQLLNVCSFFTSVHHSPASPLSLVFLFCEQLNYYSFFLTVLLCNGIGQKDSRIIVPADTTPFRSAMSSTIVVTASYTASTTVFIRLSSQPRITLLERRL